MSGVEHHVVQGTTVLLKCEVFGARPPAQVKWFNATIELVAEHNSTKFNEGDGTYNTSSTLVFSATRFENDASITCEASNEIMTSRQEVPLRETLKLEVLCK
ncbi:IG_like [Nesidiocoris tenuis]|uniref:IG_like n=1 Tax=Nesidiocoris tenuis TaxID=355587 RepID=A0ABN7A9B8_9HEMI|nr:IG_like [Nesidiocoris tenuis]